MPLPVQTSEVYTREEMREEQLIDTMARVKKKNA